MNQAYQIAPPERSGRRQARRVECADNNAWQGQHASAVYKQRGAYTMGIRRAVRNEDGVDG